MVLLLGARQIFNPGSKGHRLLLALGPRFGEAGIEKFEHSGAFDGVHNVNLPVLETDYF